MWARISGQTAWPEQAFARTSLQQTLTQLIGQTVPTESKKIILKAPEMAENGSVVPVTITTTLPDVQSIALLAEKNPVPLVARFNFGPTVEPFVSTHIKMAESSNIITIVQSENNYFIALKWVEVTIGGCD